MIDIFEELRAESEALQEGVVRPPTREGAINVLDEANREAFPESWAHPDQGMVTPEAVAGAMPSGEDLRALYEQGYRGREMPGGGYGLSVPEQLPHQDVPSYTEYGADVTGRNERAFAQASGLAGYEAELHAGAKDREKDWVRSQRVAQETGRGEHILGTIAHAPFTFAGNVAGIASDDLGAGIKGIPEEVARLGATLPDQVKSKALGAFDATTPDWLVHLLSAGKVKPRDVEELQARLRGRIREQGGEAAADYQRAISQRGEAADLVAESLEGRPGDAGAALTAAATRFMTPGHEDEVTNLGSAFLQFTRGKPRPTTPDEEIFVTALNVLPTLVSPVAALATIRAARAAGTSIARTASRPKAAMTKMLKAIDKAKEAAVARKAKAEEAARAWEEISKDKPSIGELLRVDREAAARRAEGTRQVFAEQAAGRPVGELQRGEEAVEGARAGFAPEEPAPFQGYSGADPDAMRAAREALQSEVRPGHELAVRPPGPEDAPFPPRSAGDDMLAGGRGGVTPPERQLPGPRRTDLGDMDGWALVDGAYEPVRIIKETGKGKRAAATVEGIDGKRFKVKGKDFIRTREPRSADLKVEDLGPGGPVRDPNVRYEPGAGPSPTRLIEGGEGRRARQVREGFEEFTARERAFGADGYLAPEGRGTGIPVKVLKRGPERMQVEFLDGRKKVVSNADYVPARKAKRTRAKATEPLITPEGRAGKIARSKAQLGKRLDVKTEVTLDGSPATVVGRWKKGKVDMATVRLLNGRTKSVPVSKLEAYKAPPKVGGAARIDPQGYERLVGEVMKAFPKYSRRLASMGVDLMEARARAVGKSLKEWVTERGLRFEYGGEELSKAGRTKKGAFLQHVRRNEQIVKGFKQADTRTLYHELGHLFEADLADAERAIVRKHFDLNSVQGRERFAEAFETYLTTGKAPVPQLKGVFAEFKEWLASVWRTLRRQSPETIHPEIDDVMNRMLGGQGRTTQTKTFKGRKPKTKSPYGYNPRGERSPEVHDWRHRKLDREEWDEVLDSAVAEGVEKGIAAPGKKLGETGWGTLWEASKKKAKDEGAGRFGASQNFIEALGRQAKAYLIGTDVALGDILKAEGVKGLSPDKDPQVFQRLVQNRAGSKAATGLNDGIFQAGGKVYTHKDGGFDGLRKKLRAAGRSTKQVDKELQDVLLLRTAKRLSRTKARGKKIPVDRKALDATLERLGGKLADPDKIPPLDDVADPKAKGGWRAPKWSDFPPNPNSRFFNTPREAAVAAEKGGFDKTFADTYDSMGDLIELPRKALADSGILSQEQAAKLLENNDHYVPLFRQLFRGSRVGGTERVAGATNPVRKLGGSEVPLMATSEALLGHFQRYISAADRHKTASLLYDAIPEGKRAKYFEPIEAEKVDLNDMAKYLDELGTKEDMVLHLPDPEQGEGYRRAFRFKTPPEIATALTGTNQGMLFSSVGALSHSDNLLTKMFTLPADVTRTLATQINPGFAMRNAIRDALYVMAKEGLVEGGKTIGRGYANVLATQDWIPKWAKDWLGDANWQKRQQDMLKAYNASGVGDLGFHKATPRAAKRLHKQLLAHGELKGKDKIVTGFMDLLNLIEQGPRRGAFSKAMKGKKFDDAEAAMRAATAAAEITVNFGPGGLLTKELSRYIPFFNAGVQGFRNFARHMKPLGNKKAWADGTAMSRLAGPMAVYLAPTVMEYMENKDDPYWNELPPEQRANFFHIKAPWVDGGWVKIPKDFNYGPIMTGVIEGALRGLSEKGLDRVAKDVMSNAVKQPLDVFGLGTRAHEGHAVTPVEGIYRTLVANERSYRGGSIVPDRQYRSGVRLAMEEGDSKMIRAITSTLRALGDAGAVPFVSGSLSKLQDAQTKELAGAMLPGGYGRALTEASEGRYKEAALAGTGVSGFRGSAGLGHSVSQLLERQKEGEPDGPAEKAVDQFWRSTKELRDQRKEAFRAGDRDGAIKMTEKINAVAQKALAELEGAMP